MVLALSRQVQGSGQRTESFVALPTTQAPPFTAQKPPFIQHRRPRLHSTSAHVCCGRQRSRALSSTSAP